MATNSLRVRLLEKLQQVEEIKGGQQETKKKLEELNKKLDELLRSINDAKGKHPTKPSQVTLQTTAEEKSPSRTIKKRGFEEGLEEESGERNNLLKGEIRRCSKRVEEDDESQLEENRVEANMGQQEENGSNSSDEGQEEEDGGDMVAEIIEEENNDSEKEENNKIDELENEQGRVFRAKMSTGNARETIQLSSDTVNVEEDEDEEEEGSSSMGRLGRKKSDEHRTEQTSERRNKSVNEKTESSEGEGITKSRPQKWSLSAKKAKLDSATKSRVGLKRNAGVSTSRRNARETIQLSVDMVNVEEAEEEEEEEEERSSSKGRLGRKKSDKHKEHRTEQTSERRNKSVNEETESSEGEGITRSRPQKWSRRAKKAKLDSASKSRVGLKRNAEVSTSRRNARDTIQLSLDMVNIEEDEDEDEKEEEEGSSSEGGPGQKKNDGHRTSQTSERRKKSANEDTKSNEGDGITKSRPQKLSHRAKKAKLDSASKSRVGPKRNAEGFLESNLCHQCQRNDKGRVVRCTKCKTKRYCEPCMKTWYAGASNLSLPVLEFDYS